MNYSGLRKRALAFIIDMIPISLLVFGVSYFFLGFDEVLATFLNSGNDLESQRIFYAERNTVRDSALVLWLLYGFIMDCSTFQGTHGKILLGMKVTDTGGNRISFSQSLVRTVMKIIGAAPVFLGYLWGAIREDKATWHDIVAKTRVCHR